MRQLTQLRRCHGVSRTPILAQDSIASADSALNSVAAFSTIPLVLVTPLLGAYVERVGNVLPRLKHTGFPARR
jgi:hypothetical protein